MYYFGRVYIYVKIVIAKNNQTSDHFYISLFYFIREFAGESFLITPSDVTYDTLMP